MTSNTKKHKKKHTQKHTQKHKKKHKKKHTQKGGNISDIISLRNRFDTKPDRIVLYTTQMPPEFKENLIHIYNKSGETLEFTKSYNSFKDLLLEIFGDVKPIFTFTETGDITNVRDTRGNMEIDSIDKLNILNINRLKSEEFLGSTLGMPGVSIAFIIRKSSITGFHVVSFIKDRRINHILVKLIQKILPYMNENRDRNPLYFEKFFSLTPHEQHLIPGMTALSIKNNLQLRFGDSTIIDIIFHADKEEEKKRVFSELTDKSMVFFISHCCKHFPDSLEKYTLVGNNEFFYTEDGKIVTNSVIPPTYVKRLINYTRQKDIIIVLWVCNGNIYFSQELMEHLKEHIIISRREKISRLGGMDRIRVTNNISNFICGRDSSSFITLWDEKLHEVINFPIRYADIKSEIFDEHNNLDNTIVTIHDDMVIISGKH